MIDPVDAPYVGLAELELWCDGSLAAAAVLVRLPRGGRQGKCAVCDRTLMVRNDGRIQRHRRRRP